LALLQSRREQLPDSALQLIEAIRQAAVTRQLTRQLTRLLIIAGEFAAGAAELPDASQREASEILGRAERMLERAIQRQAFSPGEQKDLAARIRRRRKELEA